TQSDSIAYHSNPLAMRVGGEFPSPKVIHSIFQNTLLSITSGLANLDIDGSGQAASSTSLASLGITDAERQSLTSLYSPGQQLWRVPMPHFTSYDMNWPGLKDDAEPPAQPSPLANLPIGSPECQGGSVIECQNQI